MLAGSLLRGGVIQDLPSRCASDEGQTAANLVERHYETVIERGEFFTKKKTSKNLQERMSWVFKITPIASVTPRERVGVISERSSHSPASFAAPTGFERARR
jgi:hypothetical protein